MKIALFCHSLVSDWNHGNAHFLRGICGELMRAGHLVLVFEPEDSWSRIHQESENGAEARAGFRKAYPRLHSRYYNLDRFDLEEALEGCDLVLVHEWSPVELVAAVGAYRRRHPRVRVFFHDTHHRAVTAPNEIDRFQLDDYDGVLAFGETLREVYVQRGWGNRVHTWHEAADTNVFQPLPCIRKDGDVVWIGNWGDGERTSEIEEFLMRPCRTLRIKARVHGVRYPEDALTALKKHGIEYAGWLPNFHAPQVYARFRATVHIPRRPYAAALRGIPTIRVFEALACGIPLVCAPWTDSEGLFRPGVDFLVAKDRLSMERNLRSVLYDPAVAKSLSHEGLKTIRRRHTCQHRVDELLEIYSAVAPPRFSVSVA
jgi:spore maturation protein CgeB